MTRIAHICTVDVGLRFLLLNQLKAIKDAGFEVTGISAPGPDAPSLPENGIRFCPVPMSRRFRPFQDLRALWKLYRLMRRERFAVVHTHTPKAALLGQYAAALARVPIRVHTIHGLYFPGHMNPKRRWLYVLLEKLTMLPSHMNLSHNPEDVPVAIREGISRPDRIRLINSGIDMASFDPSRYTEEGRLQIRRSLGLEPSHKVVGIVARFVAEKGYLELIEAAKIVRSRCPEARFLFIGSAEPEKRDSLNPSVIAKAGIGDVVQFLGQRYDVPDLYAVMDVLTLPSHREGFPRAPMEAASMGLPAVVTDIRGCRQAVDRNSTGHVVPVRDPEALADAIVDLLTNDQKRIEFGRNARRKALAEFDEKALFERILAVYRELLIRRGVPTPVAPASAA